MAYRWALRISLSLLALVLFFVAWIGFGGPLAWTSVAFGEVLRHPNGLRTAAPKGYQIVTQVPEGFLFVPARGQRLVNRIGIRRVAAQPVLTPSGEAILSTGARYLIEDMGGGSGGTEYQLTAWKEAGGGWIVMVAVEQTEFGQPSFDAGWAVLERSTLETP